MSPSALLGQAVLSVGDARLAVARAAALQLDAPPGTENLSARGLELLKTSRLARLARLVERLAELAALLSAERDSFAFYEKAAAPVPAGELRQRAGRDGPA